MSPLSRGGGQGYAQAGLAGTGTGFISMDAKQCCGSASGITDPTLSERFLRIIFPLAFRSLYFRFFKRL